MKKKRIPQFDPATALFDNDLILIDQENVTKKASFKLFKDSVGGNGGGGSRNTTTYYFVGDGIKKTFNPVSSLVSTDATKCLVVVGGVPQLANISYDLTMDAGGTLRFIDEAPPEGLSISIQSFQ